MRDSAFDVVSMPARMKVLMIDEDQWQTDAIEANVKYDGKLTTYVREAHRPIACPSPPRPC